MAFPSDLVRTKNWETEVLTDSDLEGQFDLIINWVMAALNATTGHAHDGTSNQGPLLSSSAVTTTFGNGFTTVSAASGDYVLIATDVSDSNKTKKALVSDIVTLAAFTPSASNALAGSVIQYQIGTVATVVTCNIALPVDNTIPAKTEGKEVVTVSITPTNASNILKIRAYASGCGTTADVLAGAIFQDTTTDALNAQTGSYVSTNENGVICVEHKMAAGTTSATTFKFNVGVHGGSNFYVNGNFSGTRNFGGVATAFIEVWEIKV